MKNNRIDGSQPHLINMEKQGGFLLLLMVVIGYVITFFINSGEYGARYTFYELFWGISLGIAFLILGWFNPQIIRNLPSGWGAWSIIILGTSLVFGIGWILGPGGNWLVGLPLVGMAVEIIVPKRRWPVYLLLILAGILPILRYADWQNAINNVFIIGASILFVVTFTQSHLNERQARMHAEQLNADLSEAHARLAVYATQVEELAKTQERNRLAREIHDSLGHYLTIINVQIEAGRVIMDSDPTRALDAINKAQEITQKGLAQVRKSVMALRESPLGNRSLDEAIASLVEEIHRTGIISKLEVVGGRKDLEPKVALTLYRIAQEGLTNVRKHARASRVDVLLDFNLPGEVRLVVKDNGVGADDTAGGFGLVGIRERTNMLGGEVDILSHAGEGFCLQVVIPLHHPGKFDHIEPVERKTV